MDYWKTHGFPNLPEGFIDNQFDRIDPERHRELSRRGGVASGQRRRELAEAVDTFNDTFVLMSLRSELREDYLKAIKRYAAQERRKRAKRKPKPDADE